MKAEKWARMKAAGVLPAYLINFYEEETKHSPMGKRRLQTEVINKLFVKKNGQWEMDVSDVQFRSHLRRVSEKKYNKDETEALPKSLILGMYFQGCDTKFNKALEQGEIEFVKEENGVRFYAYCRLTSGDKGTGTFENRLRVLS